MVVGWVDRSSGIGSRLRGRFNTLTIGESLTPAASVDPRTPPTRSCRLPQQVRGITGRVLDKGGGHTR
jgi:hypothetical protein